MRSKTVLVNGRVHTPSGVREGLLIEAGRVAQVGNFSFSHGDAEVIDLKGRSVFPGFVDSHMHFMAWARSQEQLDLSACASIGDLRTALRERMASRPPAEGEWIEGRGWNHANMVDGRMPTKADIDDLCPGNPVVLTRVCGHIVLLNTAALNLAGITRDTRADGGVVELGADGEPTGILAETAIRLARTLIPKPQDADLLRLLEKYGPLAAGFGLTEVNSDDMGSFSFDFRRLISFYTSAEREGKLPFRIRQQFQMPERELLLDFLSEGWRTGDGTPLCRIGPLKLLADGSLGGRTALLRQDYADAPGERGVGLFPQEKLDELIGIAHASGMQVATHAIGDGALEMCLDAFEAAHAACPVVSRHIIVHAQIADDRQLERMKALRMGAAVQPCFVPSDRKMAIAHLGRDWAERSYRWKTMLRRGIVLAGGSDAPIESLRPLLGIHAAVTRQDPQGEPTGGWMPEESLSVAEAFALYSWGNAWLGRAEHRRGAILPGQDADLVVLDEDPFLTPPAELAHIPVAMTLCGGRITHRSGDIG